MLEPAVPLPKPFRASHLPYKRCVGAVFGSGGVPAETLYETAVAPLVAGLFEGISATAFAYGQTGW